MEQQNRTKPATPEERWQELGYRLLAHADCTYKKDGLSIPVSFFLRGNTSGEYIQGAQVHFSDSRTREICDTVDPEEAACWYDELLYPVVPRAEAFPISGKAMAGSAETPSMNSHN